MRILILCTGNSCRSQMAQGFLQSFNENILVCSAGTEPASQINAIAVEVMRESGIDISSQSPKLVDQYLNDEWDYVITVCGGTNDFILSEFIRVRDEIKDSFMDFYKMKLETI